MFGAKSFQLLHWYAESRGQGPSKGRAKTQPQAMRSDSGALLSWSTCLRTLKLVERDPSESADLDYDLPQVGLLEFGPPSEILENEKAYQRILEIICGLHSPLIGETEVLGQFKQTLSDQVSLLEKSGDSPLIRARAALLKSWGRALLADAKEIRTQFLLDLGSQSYGSLVRKEIRHYRESGGEPMRPLTVAIIGGGQLAQEIAPWLMKAADGLMGPIPLIIRDVAKPRPWVATQSNLRLHSIAATWPDVDAFVLAAPLSASEVESALAKVPHRERLLIDLRGESRTDSVHFEGLRVSELTDIFQSMEVSRAHAEEMKAKALSAVSAKAEERFNAVHHRPFGWDDVWS